ncbi:MAG: phenylacetate--CoA ligase family protein [Thermoplasmatota archaeon]
MNPFLNPLFLLRVAKGYLTDVDRVWTMSPEKLQRYRDKAFRRMVHYAYEVPVYRQKYREADVHPDDISGIADIKKLPFITKDDFRRHFPDGIVHPRFDESNAHVVSTSGSTGQPVSLYTDIYTIIKALFGFIRELREYGVDWRTTRMSVIVDLTPESAEEAYLSRTVMPYLGRLFSFDNMQILHVGDPPEDLLRRINEFQPEFLGGYPGVLRALAVLKRRGQGSNVSPRVMSSSGAVLDGYTKRYIEDTFNAPIFDVYGSTEAGPAAFECRQGNYHIHSDLVHLEFLDDEGNDVAAGEPGHVVVTKLYGRGTPVIRYTGMKDYIIPRDDTCDCGIQTPLLGIVGGRKVDSIILEGDKIIPPSAITGVPGKVMHELDTDKIQQFQIIQKRLDRIEIHVVIDERLRDIGPSVDTIFRELQRRYERTFGDGVEVVVKEVDHIRQSDRVDTPPHVVISEVPMQ